MSSKPIATHTERLLEVRRAFALYEDRVVVQAHWLLKGSFEHVVKLATLQAEIQELTVRYRLYRYAGWLVAGGGVAFALTYYYAGGGSPGVLGHIAMGVMILGAGLTAVTYRNRRIPFARFNTKSGRPGLDIGCTGRDVAAFKAFAEQVRRRILKAQ